MTVKPTDKTLEKLYRDLCKPKLAKQASAQFKKHPDRDAVTELLVDKLQEFLNALRENADIQTTIEYGAVQTCLLLGGFNVPSAAPLLIELVDLTKDEWDTDLHDVPMIALEGMGAPALKPALERYERDRGDPEYSSTWLSVLSSLGITDPRIRQALLDHVQIRPDDALRFICDYGDRELLPLAEKFVEYLAGFLNAARINPFQKRIRFENRLVLSYLDLRESLVMFNENIEVGDPEFDSKVEELDRRLLLYADFSVYDKQLSTNATITNISKIPRNDPCPCGSGKKFNNCCGENR